MGHCPTCLPARCIVTLWGRALHTAEYKASYLYLQCSLIMSHCVQKGNKVLQSCHQDFAVIIRIQVLCCHLASTIIKSPPKHLFSSLSFMHCLGRCAGNIQYLCWATHTHSLVAVAWRRDYAALFKGVWRLGGDMWCHQRWHLTLPLWPSQISFNSNLIKSLSKSV